MNQHDGLWTVWTTLRASELPTLPTAPTAAAMGGVGTFSIVKWVLFQLSRFRRNDSSGSFFDCQMGAFSVDKHKKDVSTVSAAD